MRAGKVRMALMIWRVMSGNRSQIFTIKSTIKIVLLEAHKGQLPATGSSCAAGGGTLTRRACARRTAAATRPRIGTTTSGSGVPRLCNSFFLISWLLGGFLLFYSSFLWCKTFRFSKICPHGALWRWKRGPKIVTKAYDVTAWLLQQVNAFPRTYRFVLGDRIATTALEVLEGLVDASHLRDKRAVLSSVNLKLERLRDAFDAGWGCNTHCTAGVCSIF